MKLIVDIAALQKAAEQRAFEVCSPTWSLPEATLDQAFSQLDEALRRVIAEALELRRRRTTFAADPFASPSQTAVFCDPGVGKTESMINAIVEFLRADPATRVAIAVPTHTLGQGLSARINERFGTEVAAEWHGMGRPDPQAPNNKMCRLAEAANELLSAGGKLQLLCSSREQATAPIILE